MRNNYFALTLLILLFHSLGMSGKVRCTPIYIFGTSASFNDSIVYFSRNAKGEPLKSTTLAIRGEGNKVIGLLCINMYLNVPLVDMLNSLSADSALNSHSFTETYTQNPDELIEKSLEEEKAAVLADPSILPSNRNKTIVEHLYDRGIFQLKDSVIKVEQLMGISKNTIYMHIRNHKKDKK